MDFYLTGPDGRRLHFPLNPEQVTADTGTSVRTIDVIELGRIEYPRGKVPAAISWEGIFPGAGRVGLPFVKSWRPPGELVDMLQYWRDNGSRVRLLVTETPLNLDVFVREFSHTWGRAGDCHYTLRLTQHRDLVVLTEAEWRAKASSAPVGAAVPARPTPPVGPTYTVVEGDTLWLIAKRLLGDGSRWRTLWEANRTAVPDPDVLVPGTVLTIPSAGAGGGAAWLT